MQLAAILFLAAYLGVMLTVGFRTRNKAESMEGFLLGGRKIGAWMSAFAYGTSYFSAVIFIGYAGKTGWGIGISGIFIGLGNALLGSWLAWKVLATRTRSMTHHLNSATMPDFFAKRYDCKAMKIFSAIMIFIFLLPYAASVYMGLGYLFAVFFPGASEIWIMLIIAVFTVIYLVMGGYVATATNDFIQGIIMLVGVVIMSMFVINNPHVGGLSVGLNRLSQLSDSTGEVGKDLVHIFGGKNWFALLSLIMLTSLGTWGLPQMVHKFYAIRDTKAIGKAMTISTLFAVVVGTSAYLVGGFSRLYLAELPKGGFDAVVPEMLSIALGDSIIGTIVLCIILLLILSASMSTLSAVILTSSSAISVDLLGEYYPNMDNKRSMLIMRGLCVLFIIASFLIASMKIAFIVALMSFSWGVISGSFIGPYLYGLYYKKTTKAGAWAGIIGGFATVMLLIAYQFITKPGFKEALDSSRALSPSFGMVAMLVSVIIVPVVSSFTKQYDRVQIEEIFKGVTEGK